MRVDLGPANHHAAMCVSRLRWLSVDMKDLLRKEGLWEDLIQELYAAALFAWKQGMDEAETRRYAHRRIYAFLKAYGFRLYCRGYVRPEMPLFGVFTDVFNRGIALPRKGIAPRDAPAMPFISRNDNHLDEKILDFLRKHPEGLTRAKVAMNFQISVLEVDLHLAPMIEQGKVAQIKREFHHCRRTVRKAIRQAE